MAAGSTVAEGATMGSWKSSAGRRCPRPAVPSGFDTLVDAFLAENDWSAPRPYQLYLLAEREEILPRAHRAGGIVARPGTTGGRGSRAANSSYSGRLRRPPDRLDRIGRCRAA